MNGIILAAGRGSRMGERTRELPKCMATLEGRTLLEWQIDALRAGGIEDLTVVRGYRAESIQGDFQTLENPRWESTNMVRTLQVADALLSAGPCIVSYSDIVYHPDHVRKLSACGGDIAITFDRLWNDLWSMRFADPLSDAETFREQDGLLQEIGGKTTDPAQVQGQYMGLLLFRPAGWARARAQLEALGDAADRLDMTGLLRRLLASGAAIATVPVEGRWCEADNQDDLAMYEARVSGIEATEIPWTHDWRWNR